MSFFDLLGVFLLGLVASLGAASLTGSGESPLAARALADLPLPNLDLETLIVMIAGVALLLLLVKTLVSAWLTHRIFRFLAARQVDLTRELTNRLFLQPLILLQSRSSQETAYALTTGAGAATVVLIGQGVLVLAEFGLIAVLGIALLFIDPWVTLSALIFFALVALALQMGIGNIAERAGSGVAVTYVESLDAIQEGLASYREITVSGRRREYVKRFVEIRSRAARFWAEIQYLAQLPKYVIEGSMVVGIALLGGLLLATRPVVEAIGLLVLFLVAATRILPSLMRMQAAFLQIRVSAAEAQSTFSLANELMKDSPPTPKKAGNESSSSRVIGHADSLIPRVDLEGVTVRYPNSLTPALDGISLRIPAGSSLAIAGSSGAGKSTLVDVILGVLEPSAGSVRIGGVTPLAAIARWPGKIAYLPQDVSLANATVRQNVALGLTVDEIDDAQVWAALERSHALEFVACMPGGIYAPVGERGFKLAGGERQRIGLARALYTNPTLLVLDEATSALDAETEFLVSQTIAELKDRVTTIVIAHRLATIRNVSKIIFLVDGRIAGEGTFEELRQSVPEFASQSALLGL